MRSRAVRCARTPNLEIVIFSGDFLPAGGAFPWRRQDGGERERGRKGLFHHTPQTPSAPAPLNIRFR